MPYTIQIQNKSNVSRAYVLFQKAPSVSAIKGSVQVFSNAYLTAPAVPAGHGTTTFKTSDILYAVCGTTSSDLGPQVVVSTQDYEQVAVASSETIKGTTSLAEVDNDVEARISFSTKDQEAVSKLACFSIQTGDNFGDDVDQQSGAIAVEGADENSTVGDPSDLNNTSSPYFIGLGAEDPNDATKIIPVATISAKQSTKYTIEPTQTFIVTDGTFVPGEIVNIEELNGYFEIDFSEKTCTSAKIVHFDDNHYDFKYGPSVTGSVTPPPPVSDTKPFIPVGSKSVDVRITLFWPTKSLDNDTSQSVKNILNGLSDIVGFTTGKSGEVHLNREGVQICTISFKTAPSSSLVRFTKLQLVEKSIKKESLGIMNMTLSYEEDDGVLVTKKVEDGFKEYELIHDPATIAQSLSAMKIKKLGRPVKKLPKRTTATDGEVNGN